MQMTDRERLMRKVQMASFAIDDVKLFLDTHPHNRAALDYYERQNAIKNQAIAEFTALYGPLTAEDVDVSTRWAWVEYPWPWETEV